MTVGSKYDRQGCRYYRGRSALSRRPELKAFRLCLFAKIQRARKLQSSEEAVKDRNLPACGQACAIPL